MLMKWWTKRKEARHALVIKDHVIRYVGSKSPDLSTIFAHEERYLPIGVVRDGQIVHADTLLPILAECINEWGLQRKVVQFCVPDGQVIIRTHKVDRAIPDDEIKGQLYLELGETLLLPFDDPIFDYVVLGLNEGEKDILLFASKENMIQEYVVMLEELRLKPNTADLTALSAYRLFHELEHTSPSGYTMLIQIDVTSTNMTFFHEHHPVFSRSVSFEVEQESWEIDYQADQSSLIWKDDEDALKSQLEEQVSEIEKVMNFYRFNVLQGKRDIGKLLVCGDHPYIKRVIERLQQAFSITLISLDQNNELRLPARYYDVIGLSLKKEVR